MSVLSLTPGSAVDCELGTDSTEYTHKVEMRVTPTSEELQAIIDSVRKLVKAEQDEGLQCSTSDEFLLRFIRASHFDEHVSFELVKKYFKAKIDNPEAFVVQSPAEFLTTLKRKDLGIPLKDRDKFGRRVLHVKFGQLDPSKETWANVIQSTMMILEAFSLEQDVQEHGIALILDCTHFSLKIMQWATPHKLRTVLGFFQDCIPLRFETVHIVNYPFIFSVFHTAVKPFMCEETKRKLIFHSNIASIEKYIHKSSLPVELGGSYDSDQVKEWYKMVLDREELFAGRDGLSNDVYLVKVKFSL